MALPLYILYLFVIFCGMWTLYLAGMHLVEHRDKLTTPAKVFAYPIVAIFFLSNYAFNLTIGTVIFLRIPFFPTREDLKSFDLVRLTFSYRCSQYKEEDNWRGAQARFWCHNFLNPFGIDGKHC